MKILLSTKPSAAQTLIIFFIFAGLLYLPLLQRSIEQLRVSRDLTWPVTELLINYQGGFVRRGFLGELAFQFNDILHISNQTFFLCVFLSATSISFICLFILLYDRKKQLPIALAIVFGPSLLMFPVYDELGYLRKEILFVALILSHAVTVKLLLLGKLRRDQYQNFLKLILTPILTIFVLIHEIQALLLTTHLCLTLVANRTTVYSKRLTSYSPYIIPLLVAFLVASFSGTQTAANNILDSLGIPRGQGNAIEAVGWTMQGSADLVRQIFNDRRTLIAYFYAWALAVLMPWFLLGAGVWQSKRDIYFFSILIACILLSLLPLYYIGWDYGRWISLTSWSVVAIFLCVPAKTSSTNCWNLLCNNQNYGAWIFALVYINIFTVPHCCLVETSLKNGLGSASLATLLTLIHQLGLM